MHQLRMDDDIMECHDILECHDIMDLQDEDGTNRRMSSFLSRMMNKERVLLTNIMRVAENDPNLRITKFTSDRMCPVNENFMSVLQRTRVVAKKSNGQFAVRSFAMKKQMEDEVKIKTMRSREVWAVEERMYKEILPALQEFDRATDMPVPFFYYSDPELIVLEDLTETGFAVGDRHVGLDYDHTMLVMEALADFHASSMIFRHVCPNYFNNIKTSFVHPYEMPHHTDLIKPHVERYLREGIHIIESSPKAEAYSPVAAYMADVIADQDGVLAPYRKKDGRVVVIHGDLWINNILFAHMDNKPVDVRFVDFQLSKMGSVAVDLAYLLYTSVQPAVRRQYANELIESYRKRLVSTVMRVTGDREYASSFDASWMKEEVEKYRKFALLVTTLQMPAVVAPKGGNFDFIRTDPNNNNEAYKERLLDVVDEFVEKKWIS